MKRNGLFGFIVLIVAMNLFVACESSPSYSSYSQPSSAPAPKLVAKWAGITLTGETEPLLEGTIWQSSYNLKIGNDTLKATEIIEFRAKGKLIFRDGSATTDTGHTITLINSAVYSWQRTGNEIRVILGDGFGLYDGYYYPQTQKIMVSFEHSDGSKHDETWEPITGSSVAARPTAPQAGSVQPSAPAQSASPAQQRPNAAQQIQEAFRSPLQSGTYGLAGTQGKIRLTAIAKSGILTYTTLQGRAGTGTYQIDGNRMTIQMEGYTMVYTITSNTSFSGGGETWVWTSY